MKSQYEARVARSINTVTTIIILLILWQAPKLGVDLNLIARLVVGLITGILEF